jgi:hypothetical protein
MEINAYENLHKIAIESSCLMNVISMVVFRWSSLDMGVS